MVRAYSVSLTVTDPNVTPSSSGTSTTSFSWVVAARPTIANGSPSTLRATGDRSERDRGELHLPGRAMHDQSGGTAPGLGLSTVSSNTANNTTTSITVSNASGTVYLDGAVQSNAVPNGQNSAASRPR